MTMPLTQPELKRLYAQGYRHGRKQAAAGASREDCPFAGESPEDSERRRGWLVGWTTWREDAKTQAHAARPFGKRE
jgi:ribosome modulation factor